MNVRSLAVIATAQALSVNVWNFYISSLLPLLRVIVRASMPYVRECVCIESSVSVLLEWGPGLSESHPEC